ncbi:TerC family protein [Cellulomonas persica]|uniref:Tellurium resistance protein TerC n=1 Tax=Cellulomonas persica TaxID=76861 RepID=A0A510UQI1_9CELL|nr:TerC family protein [Cellulomonas persica]GEK16829.1 tellurium resistance protein TerC [Cellulomonas persica]
MDVPVLVWALTGVAVVGLIVFDFYAHVRTPHEPTFRESAWWSTVYIALALVFGVGLGVVAGWDHGAEYFAGYVTEKSLSVDNLFVFLIIMTRFAVPRAFQQKVLLVGVAIALVLRTIFILLGAAAIEQWSWVFYVFGAFLVYTGIKLARDHGDETPDDDTGNGVLVRFVRRVLPTTDVYHDDRLTVRVDGRRVLTPMLLVMVAIGSTDILFALDSIPAIYGLTSEPYIVFTANAFALLGLRQLYFLIGGLLERLVYLSQGLAVILGFIGIKLVLHAMHTNELPFINGGEHVEWAPEIPIWLSLTVILGTLAIATVASLVKTRGDRRSERAVAAVEE